MRRILVGITALVLAVVLILVTLSFLRPGAPPEGPVALTFIADAATRGKTAEGVLTKYFGVLPSG
ncbi:MAG: hypothetical protein ACE5I4_00185 [Thermoplasmata archaeon]